MRRFRILAFALLAMVTGAAPVGAFPIPNANAAPPTPHQLDQAATPSQPYAMNYTDEAAQTLGVRDGKWEAFNTHSSDPLMPSLKGGIDHGGAMISLQWRPGL
jgi:hypothetical protein